MKKNRMNDDFIRIYENSAPQDLCNELVKWFDLCSDKNFTIHNMPFPDGKVNFKERTDESITVPSQPSVISFSLPNEITVAYWKILQECYDNYIANYGLGGESLTSSRFKIHKVKEGEGYHRWHYETETKNLCNRILAWMTYLKVPEEGGETEFLYQHKRIEPEVGKTLIWPATFTHLHRGNPPLKGEKYYITGWFERG